MARVEDLQHSRVLWGAHLSGGGQGGQVMRGEKGAGVLRAAHIIDASKGGPIMGVTRMTEAIPMEGPPHVEIRSHIPCERGVPLPLAMTSCE
jgi:hypothetical protein